MYLNNVVPLHTVPLVRSATILRKTGLLNTLLVDSEPSTAHLDLPEVAALQLGVWFPPVGAPVARRAGAADIRKWLSFMPLSLFHEFRLALRFGEMFATLPLSLHFAAQ
jgi:hypothetical protein